MDQQKEKQKKMTYTALHANNVQRKQPETEEHQNKLWAEVGNFGVAQHKGHLVGLKRIYKPQIEFTRAVRKELKYVSCICMTTYTRGTFTYSRN